MARRTTIFLLVEDNPDDSFLITQEFKRTNPAIRISVVQDGIEACRYLEGEQIYAERKTYPLPDVILLDLKMPRFSGFDFLEWLRGNATPPLSSIPVVVISSSALQADVDRAYALGVNSYVVKPVEWKEFRHKIKALGSYWSEHVATPRPMPTLQAARP